MDRPKALGDLKGWEQPQLGAQQGVMLPSPPRGLVDSILSSRDLCWGLDMQDLGGLVFLARWPLGRRGRLDLQRWLNEVGPGQ